MRLARETPSLDIGCHLVLVGAPRIPAHHSAKLVHAVALGRIPIYDELAKQVRRIVDAGLSPTHLDTHKHTHLLPPVLEAVARISEEFRIPWVRRPFDFPLQPGGVGWKNQTDAFDERAFPLHALASSLPLDGLVRGIPAHRTVIAAATWFVLIRALPEGVTEFMCHPGRCGDDLRSARTRLKESREEELRALTAPEVRVALDRRTVQLK